MNQIYVYFIEVNQSNKSLDYNLIYIYFPPHSGEFVVSRLAINNVRIIYGDLLYNHIKYVLEQNNDPILGHILERLWWLIFTQASNYI